MQSYRSLSLAILLLFPAIGLLAQSPPSGIYVSAGPTNAQNSSIKASNADFPFVEGVLVRIGWKDLEPVDDQFDFSLVHAQLDSAAVYGKKIALAIGLGRGMPNWVYPNAQQVAFTFQGNPDSLVLPWDPYFMSEWSEFVQELGSVFNGDTAISLVYITNSTANGYEMQFPYGSVTPSWTAVGYSDQLVIDSWKAAVDAFHAAFPAHALTNDFHPVNGSNAVADSVYHYARQSIGPGYGASAWWWSQTNTAVYPSQYALLQSSAVSSFATVQVARNGTNDSTALGPGGLQGALQLAVSDGVCYWEVWEIDVKNPAFHPFFDSLSCTVPISVGQVARQGTYHCYPNPFSEGFQVQGLQGDEELAMYTAQGQRLDVRFEEGRLLAGKLPRGIYFLRVKYGEDVQVLRVLGK